MNVETHHEARQLSDLEAPSSLRSQAMPFPTVRIVDTDSKSVPEDHRTSHSGISVASSDTNFTDITATTTTTSASNRAQDTSTIHNAINSDPSRLSPLRPTPVDPDSEIRAYYEQDAPEVPNLAEEMEKWYAMTDRFVQYAMVKEMLSNVDDT